MQALKFQLLAKLGLSNPYDTEDDELNKENDAHSWLFASDSFCSLSNKPL